MKRRVVDVEEAEAVSDRAERTVRALCEHPEAFFVLDGEVQRSETGDADRAPGSPLPGCSATPARTT